LLRLEPQQHRIMRAGHLGGVAIQRNACGCLGQRRIEHGKARRRLARGQPPGKHRSAHIAATDDEKVVHRNSNPFGLSLSKPRPSSSRPALEESKPVGQ